MKLRFFLAAILSLSVFGQVNSDKLTINNQNYTRQGDRWYVEIPGNESLLVDNQVVTIKLKDGYTGFEDIVADGHRGVLLSRAITGFADVMVPGDVDVVDYVLELQEDIAVEIAELNTFGIYTAIPDDTLYSSQWFHTTIMSPEAWDIQTGSPDVKVAVLDSGSEFSHPDFGIGADAYQNVWLNPKEDAWSDPNDPTTGDGIDGGAGNGLIDDWKGWDFNDNNNESRGPNNHGSNVAGCIAAKTNNGVGVAGVAGGWNNEGVKVIICGVGDAGPNGSILDDAILYAIANGANIVQMSLTVGQSSAIEAALEMAYDNFNVLNVCAAGNGNGSPSTFPANNPDVMSISASSQADTIASFSNMGPLIEVGAPGVGIWTMSTGTGYNSTSGTSFSAPITSAVAALVWSENPALTNDEVRQILKDTADKVGGYDYNWNPGMPGHSREFGYGRINAYEAVMAASNPVLTYPDALDMWPNDVSILDLIPILPMP